MSHVLDFILHETLYVYSKRYSSHSTYFYHSPKDIAQNLLLGQDGVSITVNFFIFFYPMIFMIYCIDCSIAGGRQWQPNYCYFFWLVTWPLPSCWRGKVSWTGPGFLNSMLEMTRQFNYQYKFILLSRPDQWKSGCRASGTSSQVDDRFTLCKNIYFTRWWFSGGSTPGLVITFNVSYFGLAF